MLEILWVRAIGKQVDNFTESQPRFDPQLTIGFPEPSGGNF